MLNKIKIWLSQNRDKPFFIVEITKIDLILYKKMIKELKSSFLYTLIVVLNIIIINVKSC